MADSTKVSTDIETPAGYNGGNPPGGALKLPTKNYPSSTKMATNGKSNTIEGPGCDNYRP